MLLIRNISDFLMANTKIIFIRHGQVYNPGRILYARLPGFRISENGIKQIKSVTGQLKKLHILAIYTSPLKRARQSAKIIAKEFDLKLIISSLLTEVNSIFQGMPLDRYKREIQPKQYDFEYVKKGHESVKAVTQRMIKFVNFVKKKHQGGVVLAVSHGDPIVILKAALEKKHFTWAYKKNNYLGTGHCIILELNKIKFHLPEK